MFVLIGQFVRLTVYLFNTVIYFNIYSKTRLSGVVNGVPGNLVHEVNGLRGLKTVEARSGDRSVSSHIVLKFGLLIGKPQILYVIDPIANIQSTQHSALLNLIEGVTCKKIDFKNRSFIVRKFYKFKKHFTLNFTKSSGFCDKTYVGPQIVVK